MEHRNHWAEGPRYQWIFCADDNSSLEGLSEKIDSNEVLCADDNEIVNLGISAKKIKKSSLSIEMNLFENNKNEIFAQLAELCDEKDFFAFCEQFCKKHKRGN